MEKYDSKNRIHNQLDASKLDDAMYTEYVNQKIEEGLKDIDKGAVYSRDEAREYLRNKIELKNHKNK